jgi:hypothetical protein
MTLPTVDSIAGCGGRPLQQHPKIYVDIANIGRILTPSTLSRPRRRAILKKEDFPMKLQIVESVPRLLTALTLAVAFTAGTLQGSRLPELPPVEGERMAAADFRLAHRAGSGADPEEFPPRSEGVQA